MTWNVKYYDREQDEIMMFQVSATNEYDAKIAALEQVRACGTRAYTIEVAE